jgi:hypothetical protein
MKAYRLAVAVLAAVIAVGSWVTVGSGQQQLPSVSSQLPGAPLSAQGEAVYAAVEGWGPNKDGDNVIMIGYYNRNRDQVLDIPVGPNNRVEPGGPDMGQPTHFEPGRHYGVFGIKVPKDFGNKKLTWTLIANGHTASVQLGLNPQYWVDFYKNPSTGNTPPVIKMSPTGAEFVGPPVAIAATYTAAVNQPFELKAWVSDKPATYDPEEGLPASARSARGRGGDAAAAARGGARGRGPATPPNFDVSAAATPLRRDQGEGGPRPDIQLAWKLHRGPAAIKVADPIIRMNNQGDINKVHEAKTTVTFSAPGEYVLRGQANDETGNGGGGDLCCWTDVHVKVTVK